MTYIETVRNLTRLNVILKGIEKDIHNNKIAIL
jgi:hypothetical protein